jgi:SAM-dependent methyltransferase
MRGGRPMNELWVCPRCRGPLSTRRDALACSDCGAGFPLIGGPDGIPDFRLDELALDDLAADRREAGELWTRFAGRAAEKFVHHVFASRAHWTPAQAERRTREVLRAPARLEAQIEGWLRPAIDAPAPLLDIGCGPGGLLCAAVAHGIDAVGIDTSLRWLMAARMLLDDRGARAHLAAAHAEALPLRDAAVGAVVSLDVIEQVHSAGRMLAEVDRVAERGAVFLFSTPNRFSLAAEPHVGVWGVGWLPRPWQAPYVEWRTGDLYDGTKLLSSWEIARLVECSTGFTLRLETPRVQEDEIASFPPYRAKLARLYNRAVSLPALRPAWLAVAPFFRATCHKP